MADLPSSAPLRTDALPSAQAAIEAARQLDLAPLAQLLASIGIDTGALWELPRWNAETEPGPGRGLTAAEERAQDECMANAVRIAAAHTGGAVLLGLYVWNLWGEVWEHTFQLGRLKRTLRSFAGAWEAVREKDADSRSQMAGEAVAALVASLVTEIEVESELDRGDLAALAEIAGAAVADGERVRSLTEPFDEHFDQAFPGLRDYLTTYASCLTDYYGALRSAASAAARTLAGTPQLEGGIEALRAIEKAPSSDRVLRSEARAHRRGLECLAAAAGREWLRIDNARIVYLYPFGLSGLSPEAVVDMVRGLSEPQLAGIPATAVRRSFNLNDVWAGRDYLHRRFGGAVIELPSVVIARPDGEILLELTAEVRFSLLGNHYVRFEANLTDLDPHRLQFTLYHAAPEHAPSTVTCGSRPPRWERLSDLATDIQLDVSSLWHAAPKITAETRSGRYHVLVSVFEASAVSGPGAPAATRRPIETGADVLGLFGSQVLLAPVPNAITSICDWARIPLDHSALLPHGGKQGDLVAATVNTTITAFLDTPSFVTGMFETVAEFVGSLDGLLSIWTERLATHHRTIKDLLAGHTSPVYASALGAHAEALRREQLALHDFAAEARSVLSLIRSPGLMTSPKDIEVLTMLIRAAEFDIQERDFTGKLKEILNNRLEVHIDALAAQMQERFDQAQTRRELFNHAVVQALLAAVAVFGAAGVIQILQASGFDSPGLAWTSVATILALAASLCVAVFRWTTSDKEPAAGSPPPGRTLDG